MYIFFKVVRFLLISSLLCVGFCSEDEERLVRDLFRGYNKLIRPVQNMTQKVDVRFGLAFVQLINVNEKNQIMKSNVWLRFVWTDYQLQWDEADYGGIGVLRLPPDKVWKPDIVLFNNADGNYEVRYKSNVLIYPNGEVLWVPPAIYQSSCTIDVTYFPFDQQTCIMKFGSWTFNGDQVSLALYNDKNFVDLSDYWKSGTWDIISVPAYLNVYQGEYPTETDITFYIIIRRKTLFYTVNLILPTVLISFLCVLVFYLPAEAGEKVTLGISILLSLVVFLLLVSKILPPTSLVLPLIAKYLLFTFIMNTVSILVTVIIINWNFRGPRTHRMPQLIRKIFLKYLPTILLMRRPKKTRLRWMMEIPNVTLPASTYSGSPTELPKHLPASLAKPKMEVMELSDLHHPNCKINRKAHHATTASTTAGGGGDTLGDRRGSESSDSVLLSPEASKATEAVEFIAEHLRNEDLYIQTREDWKYVAMVIDRLQLYIFFVVTTAGTIGILMDAPHIFDIATATQSGVLYPMIWFFGESMFTGILSFAPLIIITRKVTRLLNSPYGIFTACVQFESDEHVYSHRRRPNTPHCQPGIAPQLCIHGSGKNVVARADLASRGFYSTNSVWKHNGSRYDHAGERWMW